MLCYLDLETVRQTSAGEERAVVDYKVKTTPLTQFKADHDFQPAVYLAGRWLEGDPAARFSFAQIAKPGPRRKEMGASLMTTSRSAGQLRGALVRIAQAARQVVACYERFGPDEPWGFADPAAGSAASATATPGQRARAEPGSEPTHNSRKQVPVRKRDRAPAPQYLPGHHLRRRKNMRDIATATLSGNLTRDVELKALPSGTDVARLRVATTTRRRAGEEWVEKTNYLTVEVYGAQARAALSTSARARACWSTPSSTGASGPTSRTTSARRSRSAPARSCSKAAARPRRPVRTPANRTALRPTGRDSLRRSRSA